LSTIYLPYGIIIAILNSGLDKMQTTTSKRPRGRPANFKYEQALQKALHVFWARGYEGASMAELTQALGINRPSIYAAFGNKEELFKKALQMYLAGPVAYVAEALKQPTAKQVVAMFLTQSAELLSHPSNPKGCMVVQGALSCGEGAALIQQELSAQRAGYEQALAQRLQLAQAQQDFPQDIDPAAFAKYIATVHQGMSVQATTGASKQELLAVVKLVMRQWPQAS
jgi:AcrR family transcriptional regulator